MQHHAIAHHWLLYTDYLKLYTYLHSQFWHSCLSRILKQSPEVFLKVLQISQESSCVGVSFFYKVSILQACNNTKKRLLYRCVPVKFEKFWRTPISKNIWTTASVYWLLHHILIFTILYSTRFSFLQMTSLLRN